MRRSFRRIAAALWLLSFGTPASSLPYDGTLELMIGALGPFVIPGNGDGVSTPAAVELGPGANFTTTFSLPITNAFPIVDLEVGGRAGLTAAGFAAGAGPVGRFGGDAALTGSSRIGLFGPPPAAFLTVPLSPVGAEGATAMVFSPAGISITVFGRGWTTGVAPVIGTTGTFAGELLAVATGRDARTAGGAGSLVLVTSTLVRTNISGIENVPVIATLALNFVPEPGTATLLASGMAGLAALGRRREATS